MHASEGTGDGSPELGEALFKDSWTCIGCGTTEHALPEEECKKSVRLW
jgi:hypothetical protein